MHAHVCTHTHTPSWEGMCLQLSTDINGNTEERRSTLSRQVRKPSQKHISLEDHMSICHIKNGEANPSQQREQHEQRQRSVRIHSVLGTHLSRTLST